MLKPIKIGNIIVKNPVIIAPMAGITDLPFCEIYKANGAELIVMEMIASNAQHHFISKLKKTEFDLKQNKISKMFNKLPKTISPISVQIFGSSPDVMAQATEINITRGADIIDINMGCPVNKIVKSGSGADLLKDINKAGKIIESVVRSSNKLIPITLKIRTGWNSDLMTGIEIAKIAESLGITMISVHGRTRSQMYSGKSSLSEIAKIKKSVKIPVIGNGDILTVEDAKKMIDETGVDGVMIGRGVFGRPIFVKQVIHYLSTGEKLPDLTRKEVGDVAVCHLDKLINFYGEKNAIFLFRKFAAFYSKGFNGAASYRTKLNSLTDLSEVKSNTKEFFNLKVN